MCKNYFDDANKIRILRTKCTAIIKNVLAPHFIMELRNDIAASKYSILVDESTDVGVLKLLGIVIIYFSTEKQKVVSTFLSLTEIHNSTAIGIGTDNANVMVGNRKSVYTKLKKVIPNLILIRCVCHSVQLAVTNSWKLCKPSSLEYLINETYNWFSRSYIRQQSYKHIFEAINDGELPENYKILKLVNLLSVENTLKPKNNNLLPLLEIFNVSTDLIDAINSQYSNISYVKWTENTSTCSFWSEVNLFKDSTGNNPFKDLAKFAIEMLSLPWSNTDVERGFSQLNVVKTKLRNRLITDTVNAVLHVRYGLKLNHKCCYNYEVPKSVVYKIGTNSTYESTNAEDWLSIFN